MGSVRKRRWRGRDVFYIDYIAATGERVRQTIGQGEEGKRLARRVLAQREAEAQLRIYNLPALQTVRFGQFADDWLRRRSYQGLRPKTLQDYRGAVDGHLRLAFGEMRLGAIRRADVERFLVEQRETGYAVATVNQRLTILKGILEDAVEQGATAENPAARVRHLRADAAEEPLRILTPGEITRLLDAAGEPFRTFYLLLLHTGLRRGEAMALRWSDVDLRARVLHVRRSRARVRVDGEIVTQEGPPKSRSSRRTIDFSQTVYQALLELPRGDDPKEDHVFLGRSGEPLAPQTLTSALARHLTLAGLPEIRVHDFRHTHVALLIAAGVHPKAIQARLGHASITTTLNIYGHLMPSAFQGVGERVEALLEGNGKATDAESASEKSPKPASELASSAWSS